MKRLAKNTTNNVICGVCAGIADYFNCDPVLIRLLWILFTLVGGAGILFYIIAAIVMPKDYDTQY